jgi:hypothetical protein
MKIHEYYQNTARLSLNDSILALLPAILIVVGNLSFFHNKEIMLLTIPFLFYSLISFQVYLFRLNQSFSIERNITSSREFYQTLFEARHLLVVFLNTQFPRVLLYFPDGHLAGELRKYCGKRIPLFNRIKIYALYNDADEILAFYKIKGKKIEAFNEKNSFLGYFERTKKGKKELQDASGKFIGAIEGSSFYMDERIYDNGANQVGRLRRGWMPLEWSSFFPEPNTPVLTFSEQLSEKEKLLRMSFLINEYFIER